MKKLFEPVSKEEFFKSVDIGISQADKGQKRDAFESFNEITSELEEGYKAINSIHNDRRAATL